MPLPKIWNDGDRLDAADLNADMSYLDSGRFVELAVAPLTTNVAVTATTEAAAAVVITAPAITLDGATPIEIEFQAPAIIAPAAANANMLVYLFMDGVSLGRLVGIQTPAAGTMLAPVNARYRATPAAGSHTFSIRASVSTGTGNVQAGPGGVGAILPAYLRVRRT